MPQLSQVKTPDWQCKMKLAAVITMQAGRQAGRQAHSERFPSDAGQDLELMYVTMFQYRQDGFFVVRIRIFSQRTETK
jgi:hypothetical protein